MANKQYIGARYVPKFYEGSNGNNWDSGVAYEPLTVVTYLKDSYTSKKPVPSGVGDPAHNLEYWAHTGAYNAQVEEYREETQEFVDNVNGRLENGQIGNGEYDVSISPVYNADKFNFENSFINHSSESTTETDDECPTPNIVLQKRVTYSDPDATANENFKFPVNQYNEAILEGFSANEHEAITQNFTNVYSTVKNNIAGFVGGCCFGARMWMPSLAEQPAMATYGGNKGVLIDGHLWTNTEYDLGAYAHGAEFGIIDECPTGTSPVYENNDYNVFKRRTHVLNIVGGGDKQPITHGICFIRAGEKANGFWNGIMIGGDAFLITKDGVRQSGVKGTVGINFASWRDEYLNTGGYGHTAIKFGKACRHIDCVQGFKISSADYDFMSNTDNQPNYFRLIANAGNSNEIQFCISNDITADTPTYTVGQKIDAVIGSMTIDGGQGDLQFISRDTNNVAHGIRINSTVIEPLTNEESIGYLTKPFSYGAFENLQLINNGAVKGYISSGGSDNIFAVIGDGEHVRVVDKVNNNDYGIDVSNEGVCASRPDVTLGNTNNHWSQAYIDQITIGNTTLDQTTLDRLIALLS